MNRPLKLVQLSLLQGTPQCPAQAPDIAVLEQLQAGKHKISCPKSPGQSAPPSTALHLRPLERLEGVVLASLEDCGSMSEPRIV